MIFSDIVENSETNSISRESETDIFFGARANVLKAREARVLEITSTRARLTGLL